MREKTMSLLSMKEWKGSVTEQNVTVKQGDRWGGDVILRNVVNELVWGK